MGNRDRNKITHLMKKAAPFIANVSGDVIVDTVNEELAALELAHINHVAATSDDHTGYASSAGATHSRPAKAAVAISRISGSEPSNPMPGMVWIDTNG